MQYNTDASNKVELMSVERLSNCRKPELDGA